MRYVAGATGPGSDADWIEAGERGGHDHVGATTSATIAGLAAGTAYRVQVRAVGDAAGPWSDSAAGTTPPRAPAADALWAEAMPRPAAEVHAAGQRWRRTWATVQ